MSLGVTLMIVMGVAKKGVNGPVLHEFFGIAKCAPRGVILGVASFTKRVEQLQQKVECFQWLTMKLCVQLINLG